MEMSIARLALEQENLEELRRLLDAGWDVHEEYNGFTLLHAAVDGEIDVEAAAGVGLVSLAGRPGFDERGRPYFARLAQAGGLRNLAATRRTGFH